MPRIFIAASGTGGHIYPALAVADSLFPDWEVHWLGVPDRLEIKVVPQRYNLETVRAGAIQGRGLRRLFQFGQLIAATFKVSCLLRKQRINIVFTTGGYIAAPAILGAIFCGLPVVLHESNVFPGRVTRFLGKYCNVIALGFSSARKYLPNCRTVVTGTPVRAEFLMSNPIPKWLPPGSGPLIVVMGGSQGAIGLNRMFRSVLPTLLKNGCRVVHLTGVNDPDLKTISHPNFIEKTFSTDIPALLQHADLAISRAGAGALSEFAVCGTPAILVPYPSAQDQHQDFNAAFAAENGAAVIVHQHEPGHRALFDSLTHLLIRPLQSKSFDFPHLKEMQLAMKRMASINPDQSLVAIIEKLRT